MQQVRTSEDVLSPVERLILQEASSPQLGANHGCDLTTLHRVLREHGTSYPDRYAAIERLVSIGGITLFNVAHPERPLDYADTMLRITEEGERLLRGAP